MSLNSMRLRLSLMGVGFVALLVYLLACGLLGPGGDSAIVIDYRIEPRGLVGAAVEVDGRVVGPLKPFGRVARTRFKVEKGLHVVRVLREPYVSWARRVDVGAGRTVVLILDMREAADAAGAYRTAITFR